jgi:hypothetical protein
VYARNIVEQRIELASRHLGFIPERHSPLEIDDFERRLEERHPDEYAAARAKANGAKDSAQALQIVLMKLLCNPEDPKLTRDEVRWMRNERALVMCDAEYFLTRYYWILNREGIVQRYAHQSGQQILFNVIADLERQGKSIEILDAKARQLGQSTLVSGLILPKVAWQHGVTGVQASADDKKTKEMVTKMLLAYDRLSWWLRPLSTKRSESANGYLKFGLQDSGVIFEHGAQANPIAMGNTIVSYHLSEVSSYPDAQEMIEVGLFKAVHPNPRILGILESTCKGDTGWWHNAYWDAKHAWSSGGSRLLALFLPFYCAEGMYPNDTELLSHPMPEDWHPAFETSQMIAESEAYVQTNSVLARVLSVDGRTWEMPREKAFYWEWNFQSAQRRGTEKDWYAELPHTDAVAFQGSYDNVFGKRIITEIFSRREKNYSTFAITGQSIEERHEPDEHEVDYETARVPIKWTTPRGETFRWELVPIEWAEPFEELAELREDDSHMGKFLQYIPPEPGYDYTIGINATAYRGTAIAVARRAFHGRDREVQVAEFRDEDVSHVEAFAWGTAIAAYYAKYMTPAFGWTKPYRTPYVAIEQVKAVGDSCQLHMRMMGINRFHRMIRYDSKPQDMRKSKSHKEGWYTFGWSEAMLTDSFVIYCKNGWYKVNSSHTIWEMDHWEVHFTASGKEKKEAGEEQEDDGLRANALAAFCANDLRPLADRTAKQFRDSDQIESPHLDFAPTLAGSTFELNPPRQRMAR